MDIDPSPFQHETAQTIASLMRNPAQPPRQDGGRGDR